ncbi:hypothetical protein BGZ61DRAFT_486164 [Ilyonectria robusta]|uniref:uncharacterized protein n=1 Tax=Ilyonectria robusta TaxID=1079257 RepID=UPI001E8DC489|nr:uncharacterized protein BGZ61DRAFT_486164 [Ilyonectria robusta]KAH8658557.1 hypothetical protein BGZ61DRAFT_486164 [Ilyonectria robusta]
MAIEEQFILLSLGLVTIAVRVALRWQQVGPSGWQLDDYLMPLTGLLWGVNIGLRRRLTLMLLFSGAIFVIMAGTIRAVVIMTSGPEGALAGSSWACRETFVAIIVSNLPILQPLMRRGANKIGLSGLFSRSSPTRGESYQLNNDDNGASGSMFDTRQKQHGSRRHPLSNSQTTAWGSEERIMGAGIPRESATNKDGGIVVAQEISVESERMSAADSSTADPAHNDWGFKTLARNEHGR